MHKEEAFERGKRLIAEEEVLLELASENTRVRVLRCIVYEGTFAMVKATLKNSRAVGVYRQGTVVDGYRYTIYQDKYEVIEEEEACTTEK